MRKYTVIAVLTIQAGVILGLTHKQAAARYHALKTIDRDDRDQMGRYEVLTPVQFKVGETIWTAEDLNKAQASALEPEEATQTKARDKAKADALARDLAALREKAAQLAEVEKTLPELQAKARQWDALQPELVTIQTKAALFDTLSEPVRAEAIRKAEASLTAAPPPPHHAKK